MAGGYMAMKRNGFTLVELLVTLAVSGILMAGVYTAFLSQQDSYIVQEQVAEMQQNIRAGLDVMTRDIRMAGYDPDRNGSYGITSATAEKFVFTLDDPENPGTSLTRTYETYVTANGGNALRRTAGGSAIAENIDQVEFEYILSDDTSTTTPAADQLEDIRAVRISILARARRPERNYTNTDTYTSASGVNWVVNDNFRRRFQIITVKLRNMGL